MIRVLILDDDRFFSEMLADALERREDFDIETEIATSPEEASALVRQSSKGFDAFLIDQRLDGGQDGLAIMKSLQDIAPGTETILFTGAADPEIGIRAYQEGAYRYLRKPFEVDELVWILQSLHDLKTVTEIASEVQRRISLEDVIEAIVKGALRLGFERSRLWLFEKDSADSPMVLVGAGEAGNKGLEEEFEGYCLIVEQSPYARLVVNNQEPLYFWENELGEGLLEQRFRRKGYRPPKGEWVMIPLWSKNHCMGVLALDNDRKRRRISAEQRRVIRLFAQQVAAALHGAQVYEKERRAKRESEVLNRIARTIADQAANTSLDKLLHAIKDEINTVIPIYNLIIALRDENSQEVHLRLCVEAGKEMKPRRRPFTSGGMIAHIVSQGEPLFLPKGTLRYRKEHGLKRVGRRAARSWMGAPLRIEGESIGAIILEHDEKVNAYSEADFDFLCAVADQIAGVIQTVRLKEEEQRSHRLLAFLHRAEELVLPLADERDSWLWRATLTVATAWYGLGFNRALLFLTEESNTRLRGVEGIGHINRKNALRVFRQARKQQEELQPGEEVEVFRQYLDKLKQGRLRTTPVGKMVREWEFSLSESQDAFAKVVQKGKRIEVSATQVENRLPPEFAAQLGATDYAILPLRAGSKVLGLVVVDNVFNGQPLRPQLLDHLETFLSTVALAHENARHRKAQEKLIELNHVILGQTPKQPLKGILDKVCSAALDVTGADAALIYPVHNYDNVSGIYEYDIDHIGCVGQQTERHRLGTPSQKGITAYVIENGELVVSNVATFINSHFQRALHEHPFLRAEEIQAFYGIRIVDPDTNSPLGVLYLDYRTPHTFDEREREQIQSFARLAAIAIKNTRAAKKSRKAVARKVRELYAVSNLLETALKPNVAFEQLIREGLVQAQKLSGKDIRVILVLRDWKRDDPDNDPVAIRRQYSLDAKGQLTYTEEREEYQGIVGEVIRKGIVRRVPDVRIDKWRSIFIDDGIGTRAELDVPIAIGKRVLGVFNLEAPRTNAFSKQHGNVFKDLASTLALALDSWQRQQRLQNLLDAASAVVQPTSLKQTLQAIVDAAQKAFPNLSLATIWYKRNLNDKQIYLGAHFGLRYPKHIDKVVSQAENIVWKVTHSKRPIWEPNLRLPNSRLGSHFARKEGISSAVAFPLKAEGKSIGALFFNYREPHNFTPEEEKLLPIFAAIAASSIYDAILLERAEEERKRTETILKVSEAVGRTLDLDPVMEKALEVVQGLYQDVEVGITLYDETKNALQFTPPSSQYYRIADPTRRNDPHISLDESSIAGRLARRVLKGYVSTDSLIENVPDANKDRDFLHLLEGMQSELAAAIIDSNQKLLGVLILESPLPNRFETADEELVRGLARQIGIAMERAQLHEDRRFQTQIAAITTWAAEVGHTLNREMAAIRNRVDWIQSENSVPRNVYKWTQEIDESVQRIIEETPLNRTPLSIILDDHLASWTKEFVTKRTDEVEIDTSGLSCSGMKIDTVPGVLRIVLRHLVRNALDAMEDQGKITLRSKLQLDPEPGQIKVYFEDSGPGIPEELYSKLFTQPVSTKNQNRGIGLLLVRYWVKDILEGSISLLPREEGKGATFVLRLPLKQEAEDGRSHQ